jgi:hypothetical protein
VIKEIKYKTLRERLLALCEKAKEHPLSVGEVFDFLAGKGRSLILIFLAIPFCQPIQIPGLSTPFGLVIAFFGLRMIFGKHVLLPKYLRAKTISETKIRKISNMILKITDKLKFFIRPRLSWVCHHPKMQVTNGLAICFFGILLALPLPIPFSNILFAWGIVFIGIGILEDDGIFVLLGHFVALVTLILFFVVLLLFVKQQIGK